VGKNKRVRAGKQCGVNTHLRLKLFVKAGEAQRRVEERLVVAAESADYVPPRLFPFPFAARSRLDIRGLYADILGDLHRELVHQPPPRVPAQLCRVVARGSGPEAVFLWPFFLRRRSTKLVSDQHDPRGALVRLLGDAPP
jgi:hypothetical protein